MPKSWRLANSLNVLESEIQAKYPGTTVWDIGDQNHQSGYSDHNPNDAGVVCAIDVLGDGGLHLGRFAEHLVKDRHRAIKYVIYNRRIWSVARASEGWRDYGGSNPHSTHVHVSVGVGPDGRSTGPYDDTSSWGIGDTESKPNQPSTPDVPVTDWTKEVVMSMPTLKKGANGTDVKRLQGLLIANGYKDSAVDGDFGSGTDKALRRFQKDKKVKNSVVNGNGDGAAGRYTWTALLGA